MWVNFGKAIMGPVAEKPQQSERRSQHKGALVRTLPAEAASYRSLDVEPQSQHAEKELLELADRRANDAVDRDPYWKGAALSRARRARSLARGARPLGSCPALSSSLNAGSKQIVGGLAQGGNLRPSSSSSNLSDGKKQIVSGSGANLRRCASSSSLRAGSKQIVGGLPPVASLAAAAA